MADATLVNMGVCNVSFGGEDLGYTSGFVSLEYTLETVDQMVDQEDAPIGIYTTKQDFKVTVPMAEQDYEVMASMFPGATFSGAGAPKKMVLSGAAGSDMTALAAELIITPINGSDNDLVTLHHAVPYPEMSYSYDKENNWVYTVRFDALKGTNGYVTMGDVDAT